MCLLFSHLKLAAWSWSTQAHHEGMSEVRKGGDRGRVGFCFRSEKFAGEPCTLNRQLSRHYTVWRICPVHHCCTQEAATHQTTHYHAHVCTYTHKHAKTYTKMPFLFFKFLSVTLLPDFITVLVKFLSSYYANITITSSRGSHTLG